MLFTATYDIVHTFLDIHTNYHDIVQTAQRDIVADASEQGLRSTESEEGRERELRSTRAQKSVRVRDV